MSYKAGAVEYMRGLSPVLAPAPGHIMRVTSYHSLISSMRSVWRVTKGPNRDWPLGLCDYTTLDLEHVEFSDVIHKQKVGESTRLHYNHQQRWHYLDSRFCSMLRTGAQSLMTDRNFLSLSFCQSRLIRTMY
jgi:hypothetical protein